MDISQDQDNLESSDASGIKTSKPPFATRKPDPAKMDIVQATQYGVFIRCVHLVEIESIDVTQPDDEGITVLHWAAINNRTEIAEFYLNKNADVNAKGGQLRATPLHWAAREGHLFMLIALIKRGGNPSIPDGEGKSCLHIAAQFCFIDVIAYLGAKCPELLHQKDSNGLTPLMLGVGRSYGYDPTRLLIKLGSNVNEKDLEGNTALHHSIRLTNHLAIDVILDVGNASLHVYNRENQNPLDYAFHYKNLPVIDSLKKRINFQDKSSVFRRITKNPILARRVMILLPFIIIGLVGCVATYTTQFLMLFGILLLIVGCTCLTASVFIPTIHPRYSYLVSFLAAYTFYAYSILLTHGFPNGLGTTPLWQIFIWSITVIMFYSFYKSVMSNPGYIMHPNDQKIKELVQICEDGNFVYSEFCTTCLQRRPLRSKHCTICQKCTAKFDHHCPWVDNCIGANNHKYFITFLTTSFVLVSFLLYNAYHFFHLICEELATSQGFLQTTLSLSNCSPWAFWMLLLTLFMIVWIGGLLGGQIYFNILTGRTTNEFLSLAKYRLRRGHEAEVSYYHRGILGNMSDMFGISCLCVHPRNIDWVNFYQLPEVPITNPPADQKLSSKHPAAAKNQMQQTAVQGHEMELKLSSVLENPKLRENMIKALRTDSKVKAHFCNQLINKPSLRDKMSLILKDDIDLHEQLLGTKIPIDERSESVEK